MDSRSKSIGFRNHPSIPISSSSPRCRSKSDADTAKMGIRPPLSRWASLSDFGNLVASSCRIRWVASKPLRMGILGNSEFPDARQTGQLDLLKIHEDAVKRLVYFYRLYGFFPIRCCIDDSMSCQLEAFSEDKTIDVVILSMCHRSKNWDRKVRQRSAKSTSTLRILSFIPLPRPGDPLGEMAPPRLRECTVVSFLLDDGRGLGLGSTEFPYTLTA